MCTTCYTKETSDTVAYILNDNISNYKNVYLGILWIMFKCITITRFQTTLNVVRLLFGNKKISLTVTENPSNECFHFLQLSDFGQWESFVKIVLSIFENSKAMAEKILF